jgi:hypothetical protein
MEIPPPAIVDYSLLSHHSVVSPGYYCKSFQWAGGTVTSVPDSNRSQFCHIRIHSFVLRPVHGSEPPQGE